MRNRWKQWTILISAMAALIAIICWLSRPTYKTFITSNFGPESVRLRIRYPSGWSAEPRANRGVDQRFIILRQLPRVRNPVQDWIDLHLFHINPSKDPNEISVNLVRAVPHRSVEDVALFMSQIRYVGTPISEVRRGNCSLGTTLTMDLVPQRPLGRIDRIVNIFPRDEIHPEHYHVIVWTHATDNSKGSMFQIADQVVSTLELR